ncbi:MAG TPA: MATE family efflux transporter, partial [Bauldia sp.]|nr:MATE family efflux transporter [Bauldia sp.]
MADLPVPTRPGAGHGPLLRIAAPITLVSLSTPLVGAVDTAVVGRLGDPALIGGIAAAAVLFNLIFLTLGFLRFSTTGLAAQAVGAGDHDEAAAVLVRAGVVAVGLGALVIGAELLAGGFALDLLAVDGAVRAAALAYADIRVLSAPFVFANFALLGWLIGTGAIGRAVVLQVLLNLVNIGASVWLVVHAGWGVRGAALAAVIAEAATFAAGALMVAARLRDRRGR